MKSMIGLLSLLCLVRADDDTFRPPMGDDGRQFAMDRQSLSGNIKICEGNDCQNTKQHVNFRLSRLVEVTPAYEEVQHHSVELESLQLPWSVPTPVQLTDTSGNPFGAVQTQISANVAIHNSNVNNIQLNFTTVFMPRQVEMFVFPNGNLTVSVPAYSMKFSLGIANWPFQSPNNFLLFVAKIKSKGRGRDERRPPQGDGEDKPRPSPSPGGRRRRARELRFALNDGGDQFLDSPTAVLIDGVVAEDRVLVRQNPADHEMAYVWVFPYFRTSLMYDPTIGMGAPSNQNPTSASRSVAAPNSILFGLLALFAFLLV